jgi:hypothetical protein
MLHALTAPQKITPSERSLYITPDHAYPQRDESRRAEDEEDTRSSRVADAWKRLIILSHCRIALYGQ